jgi:hypothetical protein
VRRRRFAHGIEAVIPANTVMMPADIFLAQISTSAIGDRPVYFSMTTQAYEELNLRPFLVRQGVAFKLHDGPVQADTARGIYPVPPGQAAPLIGPWMDIPRTETLLSEVFIHRSGIPTEWGHWVDAATDQIPAYYGYSHYGLAMMYDVIGRGQDAARHMALAEEWLRLANQRY